MNIKEVKELIHDVLQSDISEFELEHTGTKVRLKRGFGGNQAVVSYIPSKPASPAESSLQTATVEIVVPPSGMAENSKENDLHIITSPIVGTFYRAPSPGVEPYVKLGDQIEEGAILCIVEAMKLMNEIPSDIDGEIARIYVENSRPVEFGQKLFGIRPRKQG